jgi:spore germination protein KB
MLNRTQLIMLIILSTGLMNHVILIPIMLDVAGRDSWLSVLLAALPAAAWAAAVGMTMRKIGSDRLQLFLNRRGHVILTWTIMAALGLYLALIAIITMKDMMDWLQLVYLPYTPRWLVSVVFAVLCLSMARLGIQVVGIVGGVLLPFVVILGLFVMTANTPHKHYDLLLPVLERGWGPIVSGGIYIFGGYAELVILLLLTHRMRETPSVKSMIALAAVLAMLTAGPLIGAIAEFGPPEAAKQKYPAWEQWRLVQIGRYIEHVDFFSLYQWLSGAWIRISLAVYLVADLFGERTRLASRTTLVFGAALVGAGALPIDPVLFRTFVARFYFPVSAAAALCILAVTACLGLRKMTAAEKRGISE